MLHELRLSVADRPGSLARLTRLLADRNIDVREIDILGSIVGQAVDILFIDCTSEQASLLPAQLVALEGFTLLSLHPAHLARTSHPQLDLLMTLSRPGNQAIGAFTESAVPAFSVDWAMAFAVGRGARPECASASAPDLMWNGWTPKRATRVLPGVYTGTDIAYEGIHAPLGDRHVLLLGRNSEAKAGSSRQMSSDMTTFVVAEAHSGGGGTAFHELEIMRFNRLMEVARTFVGATSVISLYGGASPISRL